MTINAALNAARIADIAEQIAAARGCAVGMVEQCIYNVAGYVFSEVANLEKHKAWLEGTIKEGDK